MLVGQVRAAIIRAELEPLGSSSRKNMNNVFYVIGVVVVVFMVLGYLGLR
jgi:hypothetical protein